jgi:Leucine-rich repeat (LRR) protein
VGATPRSKALAKLGFLKLQDSLDIISLFKKHICNLKNLIYLDLDKNNIETIPDNIGKLPNLKTLLINDNQITKIPKNIKLEYFKYFNNPINK